MKQFNMRTLLPVSIAALGVTAAVSVGFAQDGTGGNKGIPTHHPTAPGPGGADVPLANLLAGTTNGGQNATLMTVAPFSTPLSIGGIFTNMSGLSNLPGTTIFSMTGGMADGGGVYHFLGNGSLVGVGGSGYSSVPGCEWVSGGGLFVGSAAFSSIGDALIAIDPFTGAGTLISGGSYGGGVGGLDSLGWDGSTLWGSTGFFYDGNPGDEISIDIATGLGTDTGVDMLDGSGAGPTCTVAGMTFDLSGQGYIGIGCGVGDVYEWTPGGSITLLGNTGLGGSVCGLQAIF